jgi:hypothetical protein
LISELKISIGSRVEIEDIDNIKNSIIEIWKIIDKKVYSNIKTIKKKIVFCENPKNVFINLVKGQDSVYYQLEDLEHKYSHFKELFDKEDTDFTERVTSILNFKNQLINELQFKYFLSDRWFNQFCSRYGCLLEDCISEAINHESVLREISNRDDLKLGTVPSSNNLINAHPDFIVFGLVEILINAAKRSQNDNAKIEFEVIEGENGIVILKVKQDKPFIINDGNHYSGIENEIKPVFEIFCGSENIDIPYKSDGISPFVIKISFNKKQLE